MMPVLKLNTQSIRGKEKLRTAKNRLFKGLVIFLSLIAITPIILIIYELFRKGIKQINFNFFTKIAPDTYQAMIALNHGKIIPGGILNGISGTFLMVSVASLIAIPLGVLAGIYLYENGTKRYANVVRDISDIL